LTKRSDSVETEGESNMTIENADAGRRLGDATVHQRRREHNVLDTLVGEWITARETIPSDDTQPHSDRREPHL
jgi:hypothetical protein